MNFFYKLGVQHPLDLSGACVFRVVRIVGDSSYQVKYHGDVLSWYIIVGFQKEQSPIENEVKTL